MPGEAFANFGLAGLLVAIPMGAGFGLLWRMARRSEVRLLLVGPTVFFQAVAVTTWMSFTGLVNAIPAIVLLTVVGTLLGWRGHPGRMSRTEVAKNPGMTVVPGEGSWCTFREPG
jgi:drug/metabolite transporter (DMT)-like permease